MEFKSRHFIPSTCVQELLHLGHDGIFAARDAERVILTAGGWTTLTAVCLMLFSLCHNPCSTTIFTIYRETRSVKWTAVSTLLPLVVGFALCAVVAAVWRMVA